MGDGEITAAELGEMFGSHMPCDAFALLQKDRGERAIDDIRAELRRMAEAHQPAGNNVLVPRQAVLRLIAEAHYEAVAAGHGIQEAFDAVRKKLGVEDLASLNAVVSDIDRETLPREGEDAVVPRDVWGVLQELEDACSNVAANVTDDPETPGRRDCLDRLDEARRKARSLLAAGPGPKRPPA